MITIEEVQGTGLPLTDHDAIAAALSVGRTKLVPTEIGNGLILGVLGLAAGNALLDYLNTDEDFRYAKPLLEQGRLDVSWPLVRGTLDVLALGGVITAEGAAALKALAEKPDPVSPLEVARIIEQSGV